MECLPRANGAFSGPTNAGTALLFLLKTDSAQERGPTVATLKRNSDGRPRRRPKPVGKSGPDSTKKIASHRNFLLKFSAHEQFNHNICWHFDGQRFGLADHEAGRRCAVGIRYRLGSPGHF